MPGATEGNATNLKNSNGNCFILGGRGKQRQPLLMLFYRHAKLSLAIPGDLTVVEIVNINGKKLIMSLT